MGPINFVWFGIILRPTNVVILRTLRNSTLAANKAENILIRSQTCDWVNVNELY